jgi:hypothetical protein
MSDMGFFNKKEGGKAELHHQQNQSGCQEFQ